MSEPRTRTRALSPTLALCLAVIGAASFLYYHQGLFMPRVVAVRTANGLGHGYSFGNDFYQVWLSCRELLQSRQDPYSREMTLDIQRGLYGRPLDPTRPGDPIDQRVFPYPAYTDLLFWPTAMVPFPVVRVAVLCALLVLTCASVFIWMHAFYGHPDWRWTVISILLILSSYPALEGLFAGQLGLLVAFLLAACMLAIQCGRYLSAGALMALATIKPQVVALALVYLLLWSLHRRVRRNFWIGFLSTITVLFAASLAVLPHWIQNWMHTVLAYRHYTRPPLVTEVITSHLGPQLAEPVTLILTALSVIIAAILAWHNRRADAGSLRFWLTLTTLLAITTITILPGQAIYDHLILIPGIVLLVRERRRLIKQGDPPRVLAILGLFVLLWPWIAAFALIAVRPLLSPALFYSTPVFSLPIRTAASLPYMVVALLGLLWRITIVKNREAA